MAVVGDEVKENAFSESLMIEIDEKTTSVLPLFIIFILIAAVAPASIFCKPNSSDSGDTNG